jgi:type II secretory pathway pseudopilin PulG
MTLMEILIVIALIAVLAGVGISNMGGVLESGKEKAARAFLESTVKAACNAYYASKDYDDDKVNAGTGVLEFLDGDKPLDPWGQAWDFIGPKTDLTVTGSKFIGTYEFKGGKVTVKSVDKVAQAKAQ